MDGFTFDRSRYCNAAAHYPLQVASRNEAIRLAALEGACTDFCPILEGRGAVLAAEGALRSVRIEAEDDCGNVSELEFTVRGRRARPAECDSLAVVCDRKRTCTLTAGEASLTLPAGALYESLAVRPERISAGPSADSTLIVLSPVYRLLDSSVPLQKAATVRIRAYVPQNLRPHTTLAIVNRKGRLAHAGGSYADGCVTAATTLTGSMLIVADTLPPTVRPLFSDGADLSAAKGLTFRIGDNFSGIASCELYIDGKWSVCDRYPMKGTAYHPFDTPRTHTRHTVRLEASDGCGNRTVWTGTFYR